MRFSLKKNNEILVFLPLLFFGVFYLYRSYYFLPHDFSNYYFGAYFLDNGVFGSYIYDPVWFNQAIHKIIPKVYASYAPNTPFLALFFLPFTLIDFVWAKLLFNCISFVLFIYSLKRLFDEYKISYIHFISVLILFMVPIKNNFLYGQVYLLLFFLFSEGYLAYKKEQYLKMSILWSIAILLKVFPVILFAFLFFRKKKKATVYLGIACCTLLIFSLFINGYASWFFFLESILPKASKGEISGEFIKGYQSILMFLKHLFIFDKTKNPIVVLDSPFLYHFLLILSKLVVIGYGIIISLKQITDLKIFAYWVLATYLLSPYGSSYGSLLLIFVFILIIANNKLEAKKTIGLLALLLLICNLPIASFYKLSLPFSFLKLFLYVSIWSLFLVSEKIRSKQHIVLWSITLLIAVSYNSISNTPVEPDSTYLLENQHTSLIYDYDVKNNVLVYKYWSEEGPKIKKTNYHITTIDYDNVSLKNNTIYYLNKQVTDSNANKLKPAVINGHTLIYLSDDNRGYGFYNFRKINIDN